jgi:pyrophosphate--fructose-6-phosphate 1-phosphotransferase
MSTVRTVAMLTAGGLAPCLSSAVGGLIERYSEVAPDVRIMAYRNGYAGLLTGDSVEVTDDVRAKAHLLHAFGGSPIGNSRVKLTNVDDCVERGLVQRGQDPLQVAAEQLTRDGVDVLHTIGGDDTNGTAADLAAYLHSNGHELTVVGLPKTIDNDVVPIRQSLGAWTAAEQGAVFARNIVAEHSANPRMLIVHEVMGRNCGWLTAATALAHHQWVQGAEFSGWLENSPQRWDVHGVFVPERSLDIASEAKRLRQVMDEYDGVNLFVSEGAGVADIVASMQESGHEGPRDPFGQVQRDKANPGAWSAEQFADQLGAEKVLVQKSGYFARSAAANDADLALIRDCTRYAVDAALRGESGVVGQDEERDDVLRAIEFDRIRGGKAFDPATDWFTMLLADLGQA